MTINSFLSIPRKKRMKIIKKLKVETKERIFNNTLTITQLASLDKVENYHERVRIRHEIIKKEPKKLFWDYLELLDGDGRHYKSDRILISTYGDVATLSNKGALYINVANDWNKGNKYRGMIVGKKQCRTHRVVASTFIPIPKILRDVDYSILEVNHKDFKKFNNVWDNLEWTTTTGNSRHKYQYKDYNNFDYYLMEVIIDNGFLGRKFVIIRDDKNLPFNINYLSRNRERCRKGEIPSGFKVTNISKEEIDKYERGYPEDIKALFDTDIKYFQSKVKPIIGTVLIGKYRGLEFSLFGIGEIRKYFNSGTVMSVASGVYSRASGCTFKYCTHREGIPLRGVMTKEISNDIRSMLPVIGPYKGTVLKGDYKGYEFYILSMGECRPYFDRVKVALGCRGPRHPHKGCIFTKVEFKDVPIDYNVMTNKIMIDIKKNT